MKNIVAIITAAFLIFGIALSGTMITGADEASEKTYTIQDIRNLQDFLLNRPTEEDLSGKSYDLNGDDRWDVFDLCLMKREFLNQNQEDASDILVAYFSRTGNTEQIANHIIDVTGADRYVIEAAVPYTDEDIAYSNSSCRANREQNDKSVRPEIAEPLASIEPYDVIFIGYPIWWGQEPRIIDTFLESYDFSDKTVIPFCTSGSSAISTSENNIKNLVPIGNQLGGKRFSANASIETVSEWIDSLPILEKKEETKLNIEVNGRNLTASLEDNSSAKALIELIKNEPLTLELNDYANFEKVGPLPQSLPRNDERFTTQAGDIILYQGDKFVLYYDTNTWNFTKLGHVENISQAELMELLGEGSVMVTLSLSK